LKTSARISSIEQTVKTHFALADSRAAIATEHLPPTGHTPASKIASALRTEHIQSQAVKAVERIRDSLKNTMVEAEAELDAIDQEAADAVATAAFIVGKADSLPTGIPPHIAAAAIALKGSSGAATISRQLVLASENAEAEVNRLRERWLPRTKHAASAAIHGHAARIYRAAGLERKAMASELMSQRAKLHRNNHIEKASRRRLADV